MENLQYSTEKNSSKTWFSKEKLQIPTENLDRDIFHEKLAECQSFSWKSSLIDQFF